MPPTIMIKRKLAHGGPSIGLEQVTGRMQKNGEVRPLPSSGIVIVWVGTVPIQSRNAN